MNLGCRYQNQSGQSGTDYYAQYNSGYYGQGVYDASYYYQKQAQSSSQQNQPAPEDPSKKPTTTAPPSSDKTDVASKSSEPTEVTEPTPPGVDDMEGRCCVQHMLVTLILLACINPSGFLT